jgi:hypothetical protein
MATAFRIKQLIKAKLKPAIKKQNATTDRLDLPRYRWQNINVETPQTNEE